MKFSWRYLKSFLSETVVEKGHSEFSPGLQVEYAYGRMMLNSAKVNYSFGRLDAVFRSAFKQLLVGSRRPKAVLLLGLGAGNVVQILHEYDPNMRIVAVEIDPEVIRLAEAHFAMQRGPQLEVVLADAITFVTACKEQFGMVVVDLFIDDQVPEAACTETFLHLLAGLVITGGILVFNRLAHTPELRQQTEAFGRKMIAALPGTRFIDADLNKVLVYEKN